MYQGKGLRLISFFALAGVIFFVGCNHSGSDGDNGGACTGGRFLLDFSESLFEKGKPIFPCAETLVVGSDAASIEKGCNPAAAQVQTTDEGLSVEVQWDRCESPPGADSDCVFEAVQLNAASRTDPNGPDCSILEGVISTGEPADKKPFRACRVEAPPSSPPECTTPWVETSRGPVCGLELTVPVSDSPEEAAKTVLSYLGIRYATARRWQEPVAFRPEEPVRATAFGYACPQGVKNAARETQSEDCLFLNVWAPQDHGEELLPVMVFFHGGGFIANASSFPIYEARRLAAAGNVVVVTFNYRLGALGFLGGGRGKNRLDGNYGFLDQLEALKWVQENIQHFGGNPARVTLFGQSAGAMSIGLHLVSPASRDLFQSAIMESNPYGIPFKSSRDADLLRTLFDAKSGCLGKGLDCLKALPIWPDCSCRNGRGSEARSVLGTQGNIAVQGVPILLRSLTNMLAWAPSVDGHLIPGIPTDRNQIRRIEKPLLAGSNRNEAGMFIGAIPPDIRINRIEYVVALKALFGNRWVDQILARERYRAVREDNTDALVNVVTDYLWTCPNRLVMRVAGRSLHRGRFPIYGYMFTHLPSYLVTTSPPSRFCQPSTDYVCHSYELPFVFHNPTTSGVPGKGRCIVVNHQFEEGERALSERMQKYWTAFATHTDPNYEGGEPWPLFNDPRNPGVRLVLDETFSETLDREANCDLWDRIGYDLQRLFTH